MPCVSCGLRREVVSNPPNSVAGMGSGTDVAWTARLSFEGELAALLATHREDAPQAVQSPADLVRRCAGGDLELGPGDAALPAAVNPRQLDGAGRVALIEALERLRAQVDGLQQVALASVVE